MTICSLLQFPCTFRAQNSFISDSIQYDFLLGYAFTNIIHSACACMHEHVCGSVQICVRFSFLDPLLHLGEAQELHIQDGINLAIICLGSERTFSCWDQQPDIQVFVGLPCTSERREDLKSSLIEVFLFVFAPLSPPQLSEKGLMQKNKLNYFRNS